MTKIKVCGLRRPEDIAYVNEAKPDYAGFIAEFPKSHRSIGRKEIERLAGMLDESIIPVGVFVDADPEFPAELLNKGIISVAQLHGHESEEYIKKLRQLIKDKAVYGEGKNAGKTIIKAFSVSSKEDVKKAKQSCADYVLLDQGSGGTGKVFDWTLAENGDIGREFFLAGGLDPGNLGQAIEELAPYAVDLSSSLETDGFKDREKILKAVEAVRKADRRK